MVEGLSRFYMNLKRSIRYVLIPNKWKVVIRSRPYPICILDGNTIGKSNSHEADKTTKFIK